jgi:hypothetical protein
MRHRIGRVIAKRSAQHREPGSEQRHLAGLAERARQRVRHRNQQRADRRTHQERSSEPHAQRQHERITWREDHAQLMTVGAGEQEATTKRGRRLRRVK